VNALQAPVDKPLLPEHANCDKSVVEETKGDDDADKNTNPEEAEELEKQRREKEAEAEEAKKRAQSKQTCSQVHALFHAICERHASEGNTATLVLRNQPREYALVSPAVTGAHRHLFILKNVHMDDLYWYEEYAAYLSRNKFYVSMSKMTNGDVLLRIFMTRCNRPRCDLMIFSCADGKVHIVSEGDYCKANPGVTVDPDEPFDEAKFEK
jgi:hypothetical protein